MAFCYSGRWLGQHCLNHISDDLRPSLCLRPLNCLLIPWSHQASLALFLSTWSPLASTFPAGCHIPRLWSRRRQKALQAFPSLSVHNPLRSQRWEQLREPLDQKLASSGNPFAASRGSSSRAGPPRWSSTPLNAAGELNCWVPRQTLSCCIVWT